MAAARNVNSELMPCQSSDCGPWNRAQVSSTVRLQGCTELRQMALSIFALLHNPVDLCHVLFRHGAAGIFARWHENGCDNADCKTCEGSE